MPLAKPWQSALGGVRYKSKIPFLFHPSSKIKLVDPQKIADAFSKYYDSLYNIKDDPGTMQPTPELNAFLNNIDLPSLSEEQLMSLSPNMRFV